MLSSITPLGQRSRGSSWERAVSAFWIGAAMASFGLFVAVGALGDLFSLSGASIWFGVGAVLTAAVLDLLRVPVPGPQRQVDEDWLNKYRDWVTGFGFGAQLGVGFATIVRTWGFWSLLVLAALFGLPGSAFIAVGFAIGRSVLLLTTKGVNTPGQLAELMRAFEGKHHLAIKALGVGYGVFAVIGVFSGS